MWLTADAARGERDDLARAFRGRALAAGALAGAMALGGLLVLSADAERIYDGLTSGAGLAALLASAAAGIATMAFVARRRLEAARWSAALAVGAIVAGWALAQHPQVLPGLTVEQAAAGEGTLVALLVSLAVGAVILIPSLALLFGLVLRGCFDERPDEPGSLERTGREPVLAGPPAPVHGRPAGIAAAVCATLGVPLTLLSDGGAGLVVGVVMLLAAVAAAAVFVVPLVALGEPEDR